MHRIESVEEYARSPETERDPTRVCGRFCGRLNRPQRTYVSLPRRINGAGSPPASGVRTIRFLPGQSSDMGMSESTDDALTLKMAPYGAWIAISTRGDLETIRLLRLNAATTQRCSALVGTVLTCHP